MVFRGLEVEAARARLDTAREELASRALINRDTSIPFGTVTFSAGLCAFPPGADKSDVLRAADEALYRAKEAGRNQVAIAAA